PVGTELYAQPRQGFEEAVAAHADRIRFAIAVRAASVHLDLRATSTQKNKRTPHPKEGPHAHLPSSPARRFTRSVGPTSYQPDGGEAKKATGGKGGSKNRAPRGPAHGCGRAP